MPTLTFRARDLAGNEATQAVEVQVGSGFDGTVTTAAQLRARAIDSPGKRFRVAADIGELDLRGVRPSALVTFVWDAGRTLDYTTFSESQNIRLEGARCLWSMDIQPASATNFNRNLQFSGLTLGGSSHEDRLDVFACFAIREFTEDVLIEDCDMGYTRALSSTNDNGFGIRAVNAELGPLRRLTVRYCKFHHLSVDGCDFAGVEDFLIERTEFAYIAEVPLGTNQHGDSVMLRGARGAIRDSIIHHHGYAYEGHQPDDGYPAGQLLLHNDSDLTMENVLVHTSRNYHPIHKEAGQPVTIRQCSILAGIPQPDQGSSTVFRGANRELTNTIIRAYGADGTATWGTASGNLCAEGSIPGGAQVALTFDADWNCTSHPGKGYVKPEGVSW